MPDEADILCFTCGEKLAEPPRIPLLSDGTECPACKDRFMDCLPPLLPARGSRPDARPRAVDESDVEELGASEKSFEERS